jgi:hypothetical protein
MAPATGTDCIASIKANAKNPRKTNDKAFLLWRTDFPNLVRQYVSKVDIYPLS